MSLQETGIDVNRYLQNFEEILEEIECAHEGLQERFDKVVFHLEKVVALAKDMQERKQDIRAVEFYFLCLAMVKKAIDSPLFEDKKQKKLQNDLQKQLLKDYDLECSLKLCAILQEAGNHDEVFQLAERVIVIDPSNKEARSYIKDVEELERQSEFATMSSCEDLKSFIGEYLKEHEEKERNKALFEEKQKQAQPQELPPDPANLLVQACETLIKLILLVPLMLYEWLVEPLVLAAFSSLIHPLYSNVLQNIPIVAPISKKLISFCDWGLQKTSQCLKRTSGQHRIEQRQIQK